MLRNGFYNYIQKLETTLNKFGEKLKLNRFSIVYLPFM